jgi:hypothetical protein
MPRSSQPAQRAQHHADDLITVEMTKTKKVKKTTTKNCTGIYKVWKNGKGKNKKRR